ncbi:MAG: energy transducer TonB [Pyrinomonadaceae bacterium]|nr:energy transducer TonB [Pyrinomonadaceae bacterium]
MSQIRIRRDSDSNGPRRSEGYNHFVCILASLVLPFIFQTVEANASPQTQARPVCVAVLDFGESPLGRRAADQLAANFKREPAFATIDRGLVRAAARGGSYLGSLNLSRAEARDLGAVLGCDFYLLGDAQTLRRSPSTGPIYFDSYASIFLVSSRTGRLISWERPNFRADSSLAAEKSLLSELSGINLSRRHLIAIRRAQEDERAERELTSDSQVPVIEAAPDDEKLAETDGLRLPRPYRRLTPAYPETAALAEAEAMVDVLVDLDASGEVTRVEVDRWAGFGLDQSTIETVRQLHFFPAMRNGVAVPMRILLRYNFRKPPR